MWIVKHRPIFYTISLILVAASLAAMALWGLLPGIDFTGGTLIEASYEGARPDQSVVSQEISKIDRNASVRPSQTPDGKSEFIVRMKSVSQEEKNAVLNALSLSGQAPITLNAFNTIGPVLGAEALRKAWWSIALVIIAIVLFITFAFRKVSAPVASWKYGLIAIAALIHDVVIPTGVFSVMGKYAAYEVDTLFITALLVVLGFSVHNTIVVFDRVRENLKTSGGEPFENIVGKSIKETLARSMNTSLTTLAALVVLYFLAGQMTQHFVLVLIIGILAGTYSSLVIAPPLLVSFEKWQRGKK